MQGLKPASVGVRLPAAGVRLHLPAPVLSKYMRWLHAGVIET